MRNAATFAIFVSLLSACGDQTQTNLPPYGAYGDQWLFRPSNSGHADLAVFMAWDYSDVAFRAWCESSNRLVIQYFADGLVPIDGFEMKLYLDGTPYALETRKGTSYGEARLVLEGRIAITSAMATSIAAARSIDIDAPNEMGEPIYTGAATPLKRVVEACH